MTTVAMTPFKGATRKGVEQIQAAIKEGAAKSKAAIDEAVKSAGETIIEIVHPSEIAFQTDWEAISDLRERWRKSDKEDVVTHGVALVFAIALTSFLSLVGYHDETIENPFVFGLIAAIVIFGIVTIGGYKYAKLVANYLVERSRGHTTHFLRHNGLRIHQAWAISEKALYVTNRHDKNETLTVTRIEFTNIQACAFRKLEGYAGTAVFDKEGNSFYIMSPTNERITSASRLAELVTTKIPK
jgi:hypothetical protein